MMDDIFEIYGNIEKLFPRGFDEIFTGLVCTFFFEGASNFVRFTLYASVKKHNLVQVRLTYLVIGYGLIILARFVVILFRSLLRLLGVIRQSKWCKTCPTSMGRLNGQV